MENFLKSKRFFYILTLICLVGFFVLPNISLAVDFDDIDLRKMGKYLQLPANKVENLIHSLIDLFNSEWINRVSSAFATAEESAVANIMRNVARAQALNHLLIDAPFQVTLGIINNAVKIARLIGVKDISVILSELEKESVKKATEYGMKFLLQKEIRITPGAIGFEYKTQKGEIKEVIFQYVMIYQPTEANKGKLVIRFYSPSHLEIPKNQGNITGTTGFYTELTNSLPPFIVDTRGTVKDYKWVGNPVIDINFSPTVPDLGIRPLSFWERRIWKPIVAQFKEVEVIITKVTGKAPKIVETILNLPQAVENTWNGIKSMISKFNPFGAGVGQQVVAPVGVRLQQPTEPVPQEITEPVQEKKESTPAGEITQVRPVPISEKEKEEIKKKELQKRVDDLLEQIDLVQAKIDRLTKEKEAQKIAEKTEKKPEQLKKEKKKEEEKKLDEDLAKKKKEKTKKDTVCGFRSININTASKEELQKITEVGPVLAQRIISARPFYSLNDLVKVAGIGAITLQKIITQGCAYVDLIYIGGGGGGSATSSSPSVTYPKILISEIKITEKIGDKNVFIEPSLIVVINEIAWMGTKASHTDEWIELYNTTKNPIDLTGWKIVSLTDNSSNITLSGTIPPLGFYLLERTNDDPVKNIPADWKGSFGRGGLKNDGEELELRDSQNNLIDKVGCQKNEQNNCVSWFAGNNDTKQTMERINPRLSGENSLNWANNNLTIRNGLDAGGNPINGTPKTQNSVYQTLPPSAINNLTIDYQNSSGNKVVLTWSPATDPDTPSEKLSYEIRYLKNEKIGESNWQKAIQSPKTPEIDSESGKFTITISNLDYNSTYYFGIRAFDGQNYSPLSTISQPYQTATLSTIASNFSDSDLNINYFKNNGRKIVRTSNGDLYVVYSRAGKIFLARSEDKGMTWRTIPVSEEGLTDQINPSIAIDSQNNIHIVWQGKVDTSTPYQIRYAKYDGNSFSIKTLTKNKAENQEIPVIAVDSRDNVHIVWLDRDTKKIFHWRLSVKREISLSAVDTEFKIENFNYETLPFFFSLAIDRQDQIHLVWHGTFSIGPSWHYITQYRKKFPNGEWGEIKTLNFYEQVGDLPSLVVDSQDNVHIVWHSIASTGASKINYLKYTDSTSTIEILDQKKRSNMMVIASPSIALDSQDHLYVIWKRWNEKISLKEYLNSWAEKKNLELGSLNSFAFTNLLWSFYPVNTNQPKTGYAFIFYQGTNLKFYASQDLGWK